MRCQKKIFSAGRASARVFLRLFICLLICLAAAGPVSAIPGVPLRDRIPEVTIPLVKKAPKTDGRIDEEEWGEACRVAGFMRTETWLEHRDAVFWISSDGVKLYIAVRTEAHPQDGVAAAGPSDKSPSLKKDDTVEIWLDPRKGKPGNPDRRYYQLIFNSKGALDCAAYSGGKKDGAWSARPERASSVSGGQWEFETAIPLESIGASEEDLLSGIGVRIMRNWKKPDWQTDWTGQGQRDYRHPWSDLKTMASAAWRKEGALTRILSLRGDTGKGAELVVELKNSSPAKPETVHAGIQFQSEGNEPLSFDKDLTLAPGESKIIRLGDGSEKGECAAVIRVTSGDKTLFYRAFRYYPETREDRWFTDIDRAREPEFNISFYPYHNALKTRLMIKGLKDADSVTGAEAAVKNERGEIIKQAALPPFKDSLSETVLPLPELPDGTYTVKCSVKIKGRPDIELTKKFLRRRFDWERNNIGVTGKVVPPFTPVTVENNSVSVVLREHLMSPAGLWEQAVSEGVRLLSGPMRFETRIGGREYSPEIISPLSFSGAPENEARFTARWKAGPLTVGVSGVFEMDGMMRAELALSQTGDEPVEKFDLLIPLREETAKLMCAYSTKIRYNYTGAVPGGKGVVWESKKSPRFCPEDTAGLSKIPGTFIPYLWVGDERRGIAWFADNDKDWLVDDSKSSHEIERLDDGGVVMRVRFVTRPSALKRERGIVFAMQATPSKPMPGSAGGAPDWRKWRLTCEKDYEYYHSPGAPSSGLYFVDYLHAQYYGRAAWAASVYPACRNELAYEIAGEVHKQGKYDSDKMRRLHADFRRKTGIVYSEDYMPLGDFDWLLGVDAKRKGAWVPYCNSRGIDFVEEFQVFQDEWLRFSHTGREWSPDSIVALSKSGGPVRTDYFDQQGAWYDVKPVRSYQDFCLWWWKKMLEKGAADGIYFDDTFLAVNYDTTAGTAYYDDNGKLRQGLDLFAMRELLKRSWILCAQLGMPMVSIAHMTGSPTVPVNTWSAFSLDWEDKYDPDDFQDKFSRDMLRAQSTGLQAGSIPAGIGLLGESWGVPIRSAALTDWITRTMAGVAIVHEINVWNNRNQSLYLKIKGILDDFGYGDPDCRVWNYWQKDLPFEIKGADAEALALVRGGQALIAVADFHKGGDCVLRLDGEKLGLRPGEPFFDLETGEKLKPAGGYGCEFRLPRHDLRLIGRAGAPAPGAKETCFSFLTGVLSGVNGGEPDASKRLEKMLLEKGSPLKNMALKALALNGKSASSVFAKMLKTNDTETQALAPAGAALTGGPAGGEIWRAPDGSGAGRARLTLQALRALGDKAVPFFREALKSSDPEVKMSAFKLLSDAGALTMDDLKSALADENYYMRKFGVLSIGDRFRTPEGAALLSALVSREKNDLVKNSAAKLLKEFKKDGIAVETGGVTPLIIRKTTAARVKESSGGRACKLDKFHVVKGGESPLKSECRLSYDDKNFYVSMVTPVPAGGLLSAVTERDGKVWTDDSVDIFLAPRGESGEFFHFIFNPAGVFYDARGDDEKWNAGDFSVKSSVADGKWTLDIALPYDALGVPPPARGELWRINVCRTFAGKKLLTCAAADADKYSDFSKFPVLQFSGLDE